MDVSRILASPKVVAVVWEGDRTYLALVFCKAFENKERFPIDFDDVWRFLEYANKYNGTQKLRSGQFVEGIDFIHIKEVFPRLREKGDRQNSEDVRMVDTGGRPTDKYFMTTHAFEHFAMSTSTSIGHRVREFFIAVRDAFFQAQASLSDSLTREQALLTVYHLKKCIYVGLILDANIRLGKYGYTHNIQERAGKSHKCTFKEPYFFRLLFVVEVDDPVKAEKIFASFPQIADNKRPLKIGGGTQTEVFEMSPGYTEENLQYDMRRAAYLSTSRDLILANENEKLDAARETTKQLEWTYKIEEKKVEIEKKRLDVEVEKGKLEVESKRLDHEYRMACLRNNSHNQDERADDLMTEVVANEELTEGDVIRRHEEETDELERVQLEASITEHLDEEQQILGLAAEKPVESPGIETINPRENTHRQEPQVQLTFTPNNGGLREYAVPDGIRYKKMDSGTTLFSAYDIISFCGHSNPRRTWKSYFAKVFKDEAGTYSFDNRGGPTPAATFSQTHDIFRHFEKRNPITEHVLEPQRDQIQEVVMPQLQSLAAAVSYLTTRIDERPTKRIRRDTRTILEPGQKEVRKTTDGLISIFDKLAVDFPTVKRDKLRREFHAAHHRLGNTIRVEERLVLSGTRPTACCTGQDLEKICKKIRSKMQSKRTSTQSAD